MRPAAALLALACAAPAQFRSTVPLVVAPVTVTDARGRYVDGLAVEDLILYDNNVPQPIQLDWTPYPIDVVVAVQTGAGAVSVIDKLGGSGILFQQLLAAERGQTAVLSFSDAVTLRQDFTANPDPVIRALRMLRPDGAAARSLDAIDRALRLLQARPPGRRPIVLVIAEKRDRGSRADLAEVVERAQRLNAVVYWLTWSPFLQPFTNRPKTAEDRKPEAERIKTRACAVCPAPDDTPVPPDLGPGGLTYALGELFRLGRPDLSALFTQATGGRAAGFLTKKGLEETIRLAGEEAHRQYILTFQPLPGEPGEFHRLRAVVKGRPELQVRTRAGYWTVR